MQAAIKYDPRTPDEIEFWEERVAIRIHDGHQSAARAEQGAQEDLERYRNRVGEKAAKVRR